MKIVNSLVVVGVAALSISACGSSSSSTSKCIINGIEVNCDTREPLNPAPKAVDYGTARINNQGEYVIVTSDNKRIRATPDGTFIDSTGIVRPGFTTGVLSGETVWFQALEGVNSDFVGAVAAPVNPVTGGTIYIGQDTHQLSPYTLDGDTSFLGHAAVVTTSGTTVGQYEITIAGDGALSGNFANGGGLNITGNVGRSGVDIISEYDGENGTGQLGFYDGGSGNPMELNGVGAGDDDGYGFVISTFEQ